MAARQNYAKVLAVVIMAAAIVTGCSERDPTGPEDSVQCVGYNIDYVSSGTSLSLRDVSFANDTKGWAVGQTGLVLNTVDGGETWLIQPTGHEQQLYGVHFLDPDSGWAVGAAGTVMQTFDGGQHWSVETMGSAALTDVHAHNGRQAWAVGDGLIISTQNGGGDWTEYDSHEIIPVLYGVDFVDLQHGWTVGIHRAIWHTDDGGDIWIPQTSGSGNPLLGIDMVDERHGWAVGVGGVVLHTSDGQSWSLQSISTTLVLHGVAFYDRDHGMVVGDSGMVFVTVDGGVTWEPIISGTSNTLRQITYVDDNTCIACGDLGTMLRIERVMITCPGGITASSQ